MASTLLVLFSPGCTEDATGGGGTGGNGAGGAGTFNCAIDDSRDLDTAFTGQLGAPLHDKICPTNDEDYWTITTTGPNKIIAVNLTFNNLGNIRLAAEWFGPKGSCVNSPLESCTNSGDCNSPDVCDPLRGNCRVATEVPCEIGAGCNTSSECAYTIVSLSTQFEEVVGGTLHVLRTNFLASEQGDYTIRVFSTAPVADDKTEYSLTLTEVSDPDPNEPNNFQDTAATLGTSAAAPAVTVPNGYMSYSGDVDWYRVTHEVSNSLPVVTVDLRWPASSEVTPIWRLCQVVAPGAPEQCNISAPDAVQEGSGASAIKVRRNKLILDSNAEIYVEVESDANSSGKTFDIDSGYTLMVNVEDDPAERNDPTRNDLPDDATPVNVGNPGSGTYSRVETVVASNDRDWYRISRNSTGDNTLLRITASAAAATDAGYLLEYMVYARCPAVKPCGNSSLTLAGGTQITPFFTWPTPDGPVDQGTGEGAFELGGWSPNYLQVQLPMFDDVYYLIVRHIAATPLPIDGFSPDGLNCGVSPSQSGCYLLEINHLAEPDSRDRTNPDNNFIDRPIRPTLSGGKYYGESDFKRGSRSVSGSNGGGSFYVGVISGFLSYMGDNDFFSVSTSGFSGGWTTGNGCGVGCGCGGTSGAGGACGSGAGMTVRLVQPGGPLETRIRVKRGGKGVSAQVSGNDICSCSGAPCSSRGYCSHGSTDSTVGARGGDCAFTSNTGSLNIWVNEDLGNDWDSDTAYQFEVWLDGGCPSACSDYICENG